METFDFVIVGGGSAGCVLANRLSARADTRVALIEAGPDTPPGDVPQAILDSYPMPVFHGDQWIWPELRARATANSSPRVYEQGRVMGGGSAVNVQSANRGLPRDYEEWARMGALGWAWSDVLPYFRKLERDLDFSADQQMHGADGPIPIRRIAVADWPEFATRFGAGLGASGLPALSDQNAEFGDGYFPSAFSNEHDRRATTATAYLDEAARRRTNLSIFSHCIVHGLQREGRLVMGVEVLDQRNGNGALQILKARKEVIVCAGALQSPGILQRAGIGDAEALARLGIPCVQHLPGVGRNLQDHPALTFCQFLPPALRVPLSRRRASMVAARLSSGIGADENGDLYLSSATRAAWHALGSRLGLLFLWCNRPQSRGQVQLESADPSVAPRVELNLLSDPVDMQRMAEGVRKTAMIVAASNFTDDDRDFFPAAFSPRVKALSIVNEKNAILTRIAALALDTPAPVRRYLIETFFTGKSSMREILASEKALHAFIQSSVFGVWHASGTCRMGQQTDPLAVTDVQGRVYGMQGLRVADASLMPRLPSANTNIPTIMIAEKIADAVLADI